MKYFLNFIVLIFASIATVSGAETLFDNRHVHPGFSGGLRQHVGSNKITQDKVVQNVERSNYFKEVTIKTKDSRTRLKLPQGLDIEGKQFLTSSEHNIPYILEDLASEYLDKKEVNQFALLAIASVWANNGNHDFTSQLEDYCPGIVQKISSIDSEKTFQLTLKEIMQAFQ